MRKIKILTINGVKYVPLSLIKTIGKDPLELDKNKVHISSSADSKDGNTQLQQTKSNIPVMSELEGPLLGKSRNRK